MATRTAAIPSLVGIFALSVPPVAGLIAVALTKPLRNSGCCDYWCDRWELTVAAPGPRAPSDGLMLYEAGGLGSAHLDWFLVCESDLPV